MKNATWMTDIFRAFSTALFGGASAAGFLSSPKKVVWVGLASIPRLLLLGNNMRLTFFLRHLPLWSVVNRQVKTAHRKKEILVTLRLVERFQQTKLSDWSFVQIFGSFCQQQAGFKGKEAISKSSPSLKVYRVNMITYERNLFLRHLERRVYIRM